MHIILQVQWIGMAGMGPSAWNRDSKIPAMHTPHRHEHHTGGAGQNFLEIPRASASGRRSLCKADSKCTLKI